MFKKTKIIEYKLFITNFFKKKFSYFFTNKCKYQNTYYINIKILIKNFF